MASPPAYLVLSLLFLAAAQSPAEPDPVEILTKDGSFSTLLDLLTQADLIGAIGDRLNTTGITLLAPTDNAFGKIGDTLEQLSETDKKTILLYHALDKYVTFSNLEVEGQPRATLAPGLTLNFTFESTEDHTDIYEFSFIIRYQTVYRYQSLRMKFQGLTLNFTRANGLVNVSTGVVNTVVGSLYDMSPLGIFPVEDVLIPPNFAAGPEPSAPPTFGGNIAPPPKSAARLKRVGWGGLISAVLACMSFAL